MQTFQVNVYSDQLIYMYTCCIHTHTTQITYLTQLEHPWQGKGRKM